MSPALEPDGKYSDPNFFWPVQYSCPKERDDGILVVVLRSNDGNEIRATAIYSSGTLVHAYADYRENEAQRYTRIYDVDFRTETDAKKVSEGTTFARHPDALNLAVCHEGEDVRARYDQVIKANREALASH